MGQAQSFGGVIDGGSNTQGMHVLPQRSGSFGNNKAGGNQNGSSLMPVSHSRQGNQYRNG